MTNSKTLRRAALALGVAGVAALGIEVIASCGSTPQTNPPDTGAPIHIGALVALSGALKGTGTSLQNAMLVASQQINAYGGILGRPVVFDIKDDQTDNTQQFTDTVNGLLGSKVAAMLGPTGSTSTNIAQKLTYAAKTIEITATATSPLLSDAQPPTDRYLFRTVPNDVLQAQALAIFAFGGVDALVSDGGTTPVVDSGSGSVDASTDAGPPPTPTGTCRRAAVFYNNDDYGTPFFNLFKPDFEDPTFAGPGAIVVAQPIPADALPSYTDQLSAVQLAKPDCLVLIAYDPAADEIMRELRTLQSQGQISNNLIVIGTDGTYTSDLIVNGQPQKGVASSVSVAEGVYGTNPDPNPTQIGGYGDFVSLYLSQFPLDPGETQLPGQVANFYDAAILAALAIEKAGGTDDPVAIQKALFQVARGTPGATGTQIVGPGDIGAALKYIRAGTDINYEGASGSCDFDENGDVVGDYIVWQVIHPVCTPACQPQFQTVGKIYGKNLVKTQ